ncbi:MAG: molybdate ABC transporter substrate-binding protein [Chloroflexota bacterium]|nr:MAG: molybdate ABC transporter substrate-binding protein [Chloroflexota bacterium]
MQVASLKLCPTSSFPIRGACLSLLIVVWLALSGCDQRPSASEDGNRELIVFAAASLAEAFDEAARQFELNNPGVDVVLNLAGSQQLAHQLSQGAPADVFASANEQQVEAVIEAGRVRSGSQQTFANNRLAVIIPADNPAGLRTLSDLDRPGLHFVLAAAEVPAGRYAVLFLDRAGDDPGYGPIFRDGVMANVVSFEENVRAVLSKVRLGEADAGIVYNSDVASKMVKDIHQLHIPEHLNVQADYIVAPIVDSQQPALARMFIDYLFDESGQELLKANGFVPTKYE